ncbi:MAG: hypothetical protein Q4C05_00595 [Akkermansia sp.]|nr:hypothetical protein [Akkermansia sp.]
MARVKVSDICMYMMKLAPSTVILSLSLLVSACVSTPASRIEENPGIYNSLSNKDKALVSVGQIAEGMTAPAVYLAWGNPNSVAEGKVKGVHTTRWIYSTLQPIYSMHSPFWYGPGWGPGFYRPWYPYYNDVTYIPVNTGYVLFRNGKVVAWEHRR